MGSAPGGVREALASEREAIASCLSRAFEDDPVSQYLFPRSRSRRDRLFSFYRMVLGLLAEHGAIYTDDERRGAAIWRAPSPPSPDLGAALRDGFWMLATLRGATRRALSLDRVVADARPTAPHWYLAILGTEPDLQGRGIASAMLAPVLARCDRGGLLAYLESSKERNLSFYERHGFRVTRILQVPEGPRLWSMVREPAPPGLNGDVVSAD